MKEIKTSFIKLNSDEFEESREIRYNELFKDKNLPKSITADDLDNTSIHCIAKYGEQIIGYGRLSIDGDKGKISQMAVKKEYQKKGVGKKIVLTIIKKAKELKITHLYVAARIYVIGFYKKLGFREIGKIFPSKITQIPHKTMIMDL